MYRHSFVLHSVIQTCVELNKTPPHSVVTYYEVLERVHDGYELAQIDPTTGAITRSYKAADGRPLKGLGLVAPTHPVYIKWAQRRLQDRLEGLDRS